MGTLRELFIDLANMEEMPEIKKNNSVTMEYTSSSRI
jgi:hypothetical protein